jgi:aminopeptidase
MRTWGDTRPAIIQLAGDAEPDLFAGLDPCSWRRRIRTTRGPSTSRSSRTGLLNWVIVPAPNAGWADVVLGEPDVEALWAAVATTMRLDQPDPVGAWHEHAAILQSRADGLNANGFYAVRFRGPGTDLVVGLLE